MRAYRWRSGSQHRVTADVAAAELERIAGERGSVTADQVVDSARPDDAPLHPEFEWDDAEAAEEYRREQARRMIRSLVVQEITPNAPPVRAYVVVETDNQQRAYVATDIALSDAGMRRRVLDRAAAEMDAWTQRYRDLSEAADLIAGAQVIGAAMRKRAREIAA